MQITIQELRQIVNDMEYDDWMYGDGKLEKLHNAVDELELNRKVIEIIRTGDVMVCCKHQSYMDAVFEYARKELDNEKTQTNEDS